MRTRERASIRVGREGTQPDGRLHLYQSVASFIPIPRPVRPFLIHFIRMVTLHADYDCIFAAGS